MEGLSLHVGGVVAGCGKNGVGVCADCFSGGGEFLYGGVDGRELAADEVSAVFYAPVEGGGYARIEGGLAFG
nr:MAG TPA: hypothetical protein [Caudoviricetes sp.]